MSYIVQGVPLTIQIQEDGTTLGFATALNFTTNVTASGTGYTKAVAATGGGGGGGITTPGSTTDNAIVRWDGTDGTAIQNSTVVISDSGDINLKTMDASDFGRKFGIAGTGGAMTTGVSGGAWVEYQSTSGNDQQIVWVTHHNNTSHGVRMVLNRDGYLGLGETSPDERLHVVGSAKLETSGSAGPELVISNTDTGGAEWRISSCGSADDPGAGRFGIRSYTDARWFVVIDGDTACLSIGNNGTGAEPNLLPTSGVSIFGTLALESYETASSVTLDGRVVNYVTDTTASRTLTLPAAANCLDRVYYIVDKSGGAGTNNITIDPNGSETINGATNYVLRNNYGAVAIQSDGTGWHILYEYKPNRNLGVEGANVTAANDLTLGFDGNFFTITGNTEIQRITNVGWTAGSEIKLLFTGTPTVKHNQPVTSGFSAILVDGSADYEPTAGSIAELFFDGTDFYLHPYYTA